jgi:hypothetical protein
MIDGAIVNNTHVDKKLNLIKQYTATELQLENYQNALEEMGFKVEKKALVYIGEKTNVVNF